MKRLRNKSICECGVLAIWAIDRAIPIHFDRHSGAYRINVTRTTIRDLSFCFLCGGSPARHATSKCRCKKLSEWAGLPGSCVRYDTILNEYQLCFGQGGTLIFYYCPNCGGRLSKSKRHKLFKKVSKQEKLVFKEKLEGVRRLSQVLQVLGEPDERRSDFKHDKKLFKVYGFVGIKEMLRYTQVARSFDIIAQELQNGEMQIIYQAKRKKAG